MSVLAAAGTLAALGPLAAYDKKRQAMCLAAAQKPPTLNCVNCGAPAEPTSTCSYCKTPRLAR